MKSSVQKLFKNYDKPHEKVVHRKYFALRHEKTPNLLGDEEDLVCCKMHLALQFIAAHLSANVNFYYIHAVFSC